ncbi:hypothetical protein HOE67_02665 [Candidatus Peregrinibacteria bacterium]|jgi:F-type H+-transporting ATPase subunit delta|nr:hypothetical protein [Candidatus Peregrinibacteria bacterium]MBT4055989.1 hypothetical protein [Candidatus Peregrinibacteria bacterium]
MKVSTQKYAKALVASIKDEKDKKVIDERIQNLIKILVKRKETKSLKRFPEIFKQLWMREKGQLEVALTLPYKPNDKDKMKLVKLLGDALNKEVILNINVDEAVLGGMKLAFGEYVIDGTVARTLELLKSNISNTNN